MTIHWWLEMGRSFVDIPGCFLGSLWACLSRLRCLETFCLATMPNYDAWMFLLGYEAWSIRIGLWSLLDVFFFFLGVRPWLWQDYEVLGAMKLGDCWTMKSVFGWLWCQGSSLWGRATKPKCDWCYETLYLVNFMKHFMEGNKPCRGEPIFGCVPT